MRQSNTAKPGDKVYRVPRITPWQIQIQGVRQQKIGGVSLLSILYGFLGFILVGTVLLMLPISSNSGIITFPVDALFTATSAVCVTGLSVLDTANHFSFFGQFVILLLMQLGGFGFMTSAVLFIMALGRRIGLRERILIGESLGIERLSGIVRLIRKIALFALISESIGALLLFFPFAANNPLPVAVWKAVFQSVSAFNNAGFDIHGNFRSLTDFQQDSVVLLTTAALIILGGISFTVVYDVLKTRRFSMLPLDTKMVLVITGALLAFGTILFFSMEFTNPNTIGPLAFPDKLLNAFFHSATPRTAGFNSIDVGKMMDYSLIFTILLMFIGGASGSTAGGVKVNTFGIIFATVWSIIKGKEHPGAFGREFKTHDIYRAMAVIILSVTLISIIVLSLTITEDFPFLSIVFEAFSAFGTVGLSTGITPTLSIAGKLIITVTMLIGRLGPLTVALSLVQQQHPSAYRYPQQSIKIG